LASSQVLTPEEQARIFSIQDLLVDSLAEHKEAIQKGQETRAKELEKQMESLRLEKKSIRKTAIEIGL
jgi:hypothetical protein